MTRQAIPLTALATMALLVFFATDVSAQVIHLSSKAVVESGQDVRLGNISTITGTDQQTAEKLANTVIANANPNSISIKAESVIMAIVAQMGTSALTSNFQLSGSASCEVRIGSVPVAANAPVSVSGAAAPDVFAPVPSNLPTPVAASDSAPVITAGVMPQQTALDQAGSTVPLSQQIRDHIMHETGCSADQIRMTINTSDPIVDAAPPEKCRWNLHFQSRTLIGGIPVQADLIQGSRIKQSLHFDVSVERSQQLVVATTGLSRGDVMTPEKFAVQTVWLDRNMPTLFLDKNAVLGLEAQRDIVTGEQLDTRDFKPVEMVARGDTLNVVFVSGPLQVRMTARAKDSGKMHQTINVCNESTNQNYSATLIGKHLAVVGATLTDEQEAKLREAH